VAFGYVDSYSEVFCFLFCCRWRLICHLLEDQQKNLGVPICCKMQMQKPKTEGEIHSRCVKRRYTTLEESTKIKTIVNKTKYG